MLSRGLLAGKEEWTGVRTSKIITISSSDRVPTSYWPTIYIWVKMIVYTHTLVHILLPLYKSYLVHLLAGGGGKLL